MAEATASEGVPSDRGIPIALIERHKNDMCQIPKLLAAQIPFRQLGAARDDHLKVGGLSVRLIWRTEHPESGHYQGTTGVRVFIPSRTPQEVKRCVELVDLLYRVLYARIEKIFSDGDDDATPRTRSTPTLLYTCHHENTSAERAAYALQNPSIYTLLSDGCGEYVIRVIFYDTRVTVLRTQCTSVFHHPNADNGDGSQLAYLEANHLEYSEKNKEPFWRCICRLQRLMTKEPLWLVTYGVRNELQKHKMLAFCMSSHARLGQDSPCRALDSDMRACIAQSLIYFDILEVYELFISKIS